jgi:hypothetical protein
MDTLLEQLDAKFRVWQPDMAVRCGNEYGKSLKWPIGML